MLTCGRCLRRPGCISGRCCTTRASGPCWKTVRLLPPLFLFRSSSSFALPPSNPPPQPWPRCSTWRPPPPGGLCWLKVPPPINQFTRAIENNQAAQLFKLLLKYRPEDKAEKRERLAAAAEAAAKNETVETKKPVVVKYGLNHIAYLVEQQKAQLVVIAHDVDPIELVLWLPALCKKQGVPYCIVKGKARLGAVVHKKTATALAITGVKAEDKSTLSKLVESFTAQFNEGSRVPWGGGIMGAKSQHRTKVKERMVARELAQRAAV